MRTLRLLSRNSESVPVSVAWYLSELGVAKGRQELFIRQSPERLKILREHALVESAVSSNRIEGVEVDRKRVKTIVFGKPTLKDRDEEELRGYREALNLIHDKGASLPVSEETILYLHRMTRGDIWDAGKYKQKNGDIIETYPDGRSRVRFKTVSAKNTPRDMKLLVEDYHDLLTYKQIP